MANPTGSNAVAGDIAKTGIYEAIQRGVAGSTTITKGDTIGFDSNGYAIQGTTSLQIARGFGVAMFSADNGSGSAGDITVEVAIGNSWVFVKAGGTIKPMSLVKIASATTVAAHTAPSDATTTITNTTTATEIDNARNYLGLLFGRYMGHQLEEDEMTDAANTDVIIVRLGL